MAYEMLQGFGDAARGEWTEDRPQAFHLRRRLTSEEQTQVGDAVDCRGTEEAVKRFAAMKNVMHPAALPLAMEELAESAAIKGAR